ncbi:hypothetical protein GWI34_42835, partial [Actinomadura sp. DSM 109109]|nr:hypothetical protein [Actinomadura lepetitiana]
VAERSRAVKCPPLSYQLVGTKKMQQLWAQAGVVERYAASPRDAAAIRACFAGLWSLDPADKGHGDTVRAAAAAAPAAAAPRRRLARRRARSRRPSRRRSATSSSRSGREAATTCTAPPWPQR